MSATQAPPCPDCQGTSVAHGAAGWMICWCRWSGRVAAQMQAREDAICDLQALDPAKLDALEAALPEDLRGGEILRLVRAVMG